MEAKERESSKKPAPTSYPGRALGPRPFSSVRGCVNRFCEIPVSCRRRVFVVASLVLCHGRGDGVLVGGLSCGLFLAATRTEVRARAYFFAHFAEQ